MESMAMELCELWLSHIIHGRIIVKGKAEDFKGHAETHA
jgi:hypothetical protein